MLPTSTSNIGLQVTVKSGLVLLLTAVQMEALHAGDDVRVVNRTGRQVDVQGIDNHQIVDIPIVTAGAVVKSQCGEVIIVMHQYTYTGKGKTIHSSGQLEWYKQEVDDKSIKVGGKQHIKTLDGYVITLNVKLR
jgi:hypothetical protein